MSIFVVIPLVVSALAIVACQQPLDNVSEISSYRPTESLQSSALKQCESFAEALDEENRRLRREIKKLEMKIEGLEEIEEGEEYEEEEDGKDGSNESEEPSKGLRSRRGAACDGGTLAAWACAPQCVFKLKGLCGLSLKSICHC